MLRSYPEAWTWQVSKQTPTSPPAARASDSIAAIWSKRQPRQLPCPAVTSMRSFTRRPRVRSCTASSDAATMADAVALAGAQVRARVEHDVFEPELLGASHFLLERGARFFQDHRIGRAQVDEVRGVRQHRPGQLRPLGAEARRLAGGEWPGAPLRGGTGEDLNRFAAILERARDGGERAAGDGLMGTKEHPASIAQVAKDP